MESTRGLCSQAGAPLDWIKPTLASPWRGTGCGPPASPWGAPGELLYSQAPVRDPTGPSPPPHFRQQLPTPEKGMMAPTNPENAFYKEDTVLCNAILVTAAGDKAWTGHGHKVPAAPSQPHTGS